MHLQDAKKLILETQKALRLAELRVLLDRFHRSILRLDVSDIQTKYQRMQENPFRFMRGTDFVYFFDLSKVLLEKRKPVWIQGDLHFDNFGVCHNAKGKLVFDVNDFDEAYLADFLYDIIRMSLSIVLITSERGYSLKEKHDLIASYITSYVEFLKKIISGLDPVHIEFEKKIRKGW